MRKILFLSLLSILFLSMFVSADLGTIKKGTCVLIKEQTEGSSANVSTIDFPDTTIGLTDAPMSKNGTTQFYQFCNNQQMGKYNYGVHDNLGNQYSNTYDVTADGKPFSYFPIVYLLIVLSLIFMIFGKYLGVIFKSSIWNTFAGILFLIAGVLTFTQGFNYTDYSTLDGQALGIILLGLGMIITYYSNKEVFD